MKISSTNGQALKALSPPILELNGHRIFLMPLHHPHPLNGLAISGGIVFAASLTYYMKWFKISWADSTVQVSHKYSTKNELSRHMNLIFIQ